MNSEKQTTLTKSEKKGLPEITNMRFIDGYYQLNYGISFDYFLANLDKGLEYLKQNNFISKAF